SVLVDTFGTGKVSSDELVRIIREAFDLRPKGIIDMLGLKRPIYQATAAYGHFGRQPSGGTFSWEKTDKAEQLAKLATQSTVAVH
ncbi:MAG TPA: methionine adenosyltransferase domain-containing protein, partial [Terriglobia bacterium]|nr:methionine adenosyltransferase domain-containing protein [Terriglobia bacterium]